MSWVRGGGEEEEEERGGDSGQRHKGETGAKAERELMSAGDGTGHAERKEVVDEHVDI